MQKKATLESARKAAPERLRRNQHSPRSSVEPRQFAAPEDVASDTYEKPGKMLHPTTV